jgi:hypothetical protein
MQAAENCPRAMTQPHPRVLAASASVATFVHDRDWDSDRKTEIEIHPRALG